MNRLIFVVFVVWNSRIPNMGKVGVFQPLKYALAVGWSLAMKMPLLQEP